MGSSFTEFRGKGFWSHDRLLEAWLRVLCLHLGKDADVPGWQHDLRDRWLLVSSGGMVGCIAPCLNQFITDEARVGIMLRCSLGAIQSLRAFGEYVPATFLNALGFSEKYTPDLPTQWFERIAERFSMLLRGELETDASTSPVLPATRHNQAWDELEQPQDQMTPESENKLLARRFMEEVVNAGAVDRLSEFLAPEYVAPHLGIAGIEQAREHLLTFRHCYPDMEVTIEGQVAEADIVATWYLMRGTHLGAYGVCQPRERRLRCGR